MTFAWQHKDYKNGKWISKTPTHIQIDGNISSIEANKIEVKSVNVKEQENDENLQKQKSFYDLTPSEQDQYVAEFFNNRQNIRQKELEEKYPPFFATAHSTAVFCLAAASIAIQILMIVYQMPYYQVSSGMWVAAYFSVPAIFSLVIIKKRKYSLYIATHDLYAAGIFVSFGGLIIVNVLPYTSTGCTINISCIPNPLNAVMIIIGCLFIILSLLYIIVPKQIMHRLISDQFSS